MKETITNLSMSILDLLGKGNDRFTVVYGYTLILFIVFFSIVL